MFMKRIILIMYFLAIMSISAGCVGAGFAIGRMEAAATAGYEAASPGTNTLRAQEANIYEVAAVINPPPQIIQAEVSQEIINAATNAAQLFTHSIFAPVNENYFYDFYEINTTEDEKIIAGHIAITFDDGPHPTLTPLLLDALAERNVKATFFLLGVEVDRHPHIVARMYEEGHSIGNHSYFHPRFTGISRQAIISEIDRTNRSIEAATGSLPTLLRPPYGLHNATVLDVARQMDVSVVLWSVDPRDWQYRNAQFVHENIMNHATDGSVVLLHDIHETSIEAAISAIDALLEKGYVFVTVEELFKLADLTLSAGEVHRSVYHSIGRTNEP